MAGRKQVNQRSKPKKKPNRYNPNKPDWRKVHIPALFRLGDK